MLSGSHIVLGVSGGIAAFKAVVLARELLRRGACLRVVMTPAATRFVGPVTFTGLTGAPPVVDLWDPAYPGEIHVELATWADALVVAPATASVIARLANGIADDALTATWLCSAGAKLVAPAMHHRMWQSPATQRNIQAIRQDGTTLVGPVAGPLASGESGMGRMAEPESIADALAAMLRGDFADRTVLVSAGPTHEPVDPVRFLGNRSSGRMGYAIAERARQPGAHVLLVSGPVALPAPSGVERIAVRTALEMQDAITARMDECDAVIMAAAVADFRPREAAVHKLKKSEGEETRIIELVRNPDILAGLGSARQGARPVLVGFAVETENLVEAARKKLATKKVDLVVANHASVAFEGDDNEATLVSADRDEPTGRVSKRALADRILDRVRDLVR